MLVIVPAELIDCDVNKYFLRRFSIIDDDFHLITTEFNSIMLTNMKHINDVNEMRSFRLVTLIKVTSDFDIPSFTTFSNQVYHRSLL